MKDIFEEITPERLKEDLRTYWPNFELVAYALYDKDNVYLYNHPSYTSHYSIVKRTQQFISNTLIMYENYPTAIVSIEENPDFIDLYSILSHELFHGYQYLKEEKRFPNEMAGTTYPLSADNIELRSKERNYLYRAVMAATSRERNEAIVQFLSSREQRKSMIDEHLLYETLIETVEGPAWYVECNAYNHNSSLTYEEVLQKYSDSLLNVFDSTLHVRRSCYSSGLFLCLLLDKLSPEWHEPFLGYSKTLYDFFIEIVSEKEIEQIEEVTISKQTFHVIDYIKSSKENEFIDFNQKNGIHIYIEGEIAIKMLDPMNIISHENIQLHKHFVKIGIQANEYFIEQPVKISFDKHVERIKTVHLIVSDEPTIKNNLIEIIDIGSFNGEYRKKGNAHYIYV